MAATDLTPLADKWLTRDLLAHLIRIRETGDTGHMLIALRIINSTLQGGTLGSRIPESSLVPLTAFVTEQVGEMDDFISPSGIVTQYYFADNTMTKKLPVAPEADPTKMHVGAKLDALIAVLQDFFDKKVNEFGADYVCAAKLKEPVKINRVGLVTIKSDAPSQNNCGLPPGGSGHHQSLLSPNTLFPGPESHKIRQGALKGDKHSGLVVPIPAAPWTTWTSSVVGCFVLPKPDTEFVDYERKTVAELLPQFMAAKSPEDFAALKAKLDALPEKPVAAKPPKGDSAPAAAAEGGAGGPSKKGGKKGSPPPAASAPPAAAAPPDEGAPSVRHQGSMDEDFTRFGASPELSEILSANLPSKVPGGTTAAFLDLVRTIPGVTEATVSLIKSRFCPADEAAPAAAPKDSVAELSAAVAAFGFRAASAPEAEPTVVRAASATPVVERSGSSAF
jgi:hypothetical protein